MQRILITLLTLKCVFAGITILSPKGLRKQFEGSIEYGIANFGIIPFGKSLKGIAQTDDPLDACQPILSIIPSNQTYILLATRGECDFVLKAKNAQNAGYKAIIVIDNKDEVPNQIIMGDDGNGIYIKIASLLIGLNDGNKILQYLENEKEQKTLKLSIDFPTNKAERANMHIGVSLTNQASFSFLHDFHRFWKGLKDQSNQSLGYFLVDMDLIYQLYTCETCLVDNPENYDTSETNCLGGGLYCSSEFENPSFGVQIQGKEVVLETVRQLCVFSLGLHPWWKYMHQFDKNCFNQKNWTECSSQIVSEIQDISQEDVDNCVAESFQIKTKLDLRNVQHLTQQSTMLNKQLNLISTSGLVFYPGAVINNITYWGILKGSLVFLEVCSSLNSPPELCSQYNDQGELIFFEKSVVKSKEDIFQVMIFSIVVMAIFCVVLFFFYRRWAKKRMYQQMSGDINTMVASQYVQFTEQKSKS